MRNGSAILTLLGVMFGHSLSALAQTDPPRTMFDLFEQPGHREVVVEPQATGRTSKAERAPSKGNSMFDLLQAPRRTSTDAVNDNQSASSTHPSKKTTVLLVKPPLPRQRPRSSTSETAALATERERLRSVATRLQQQQQVQKAEARRLDEVSSQLKQDRDILLKQKRELELLRQSLNSNQLNGPLNPSAPQDQDRKLASKEIGPSTVASQKSTFNGPEERNATRVARIDPLSHSSKGNADLSSPKCKKAKALIEGYAFSNVEARMCAGNSYLFSATRDKSAFSIRVNPKTWELIEVAKAAPGPRR